MHLVLLKCAKRRNDLSVLLTMSQLRFCRLVDVVKRQRNDITVRNNPLIRSPGLEDVFVSSLTLSRASFMLLSGKECGIFINELPCYTFYPTALNLDPNEKKKRTFRERQKSLNAGRWFSFGNLTEDKRKLLGEEWKENKFLQFSSL